MYLGDYGLVGSEMSMFTRKLEAQLRFQQIPWYWSFKTQARTAEVEARTGTHFIPALITPDKWMIHDTIAIGPFLHDRFPHAPVIPDTPLQRACCFILEDVFNHWLGPICVHTRWCYPDNVAWVGPRFGANTVLDRSIDEPFTDQELRDLAPIGDMMYESFGRNVCDVNGVGPEQQPAVQATFTRLLQVLEEHFADNDFLLGPRPCLADFALAGACKAHFVTDPVPLSWLGPHQDMLFAFTDRLFGTRAFGDRHWLEDDAVPVSLQGLLTYAQETYFQSARANIAAGLRGEKFFEYNAGYGVIRSRTQKRLNLARLHVKNELQRDGACDSIAVGRLFEGRGILDHYLH